MLERSEVRIGYNITESELAGATYQLEARLVRTWREKK